MKKLLVIGLGIATLAGPAIAADLPVKAVKAVPIAYSWTGCYIGGSAGGGWTKSDWTYRNFNPYSAPGPGGPFLATGENFDLTSWVAGVQGGCQYEFQNRFVLGVEASWTGADFDDTHPGAAQVFFPVAFQNVSTRIQQYYTVTGRLGYAFQPNWLGYVKGGFASARIETSGTTFPPQPPLLLNWSTADWHNGYVVGAGAEYRVTKNFSLGLEYNYLSFDSKDHVGAVSGGIIGPASQVVHSVNATMHTVMARANFLFGP
jgi:outer membrane immunogenic protein